MSDDGKIVNINKQYNIINNLQVGDNSITDFVKLMGSSIPKLINVAKKLRGEKTDDVEKISGEEAEKEENRNNVLLKSVPHLKEDINLEEIEKQKDWFNKVREEIKLVTDEDMQELWAKLIAEEANNPGTFPRRTIQIISSMDKEDAINFEKICGFSVHFLGARRLFIFDRQNDIFTKNEINYDNIARLQDLNLIRFVVQPGFQRRITLKHETTLRINYHDNTIDVQLPVGGSLIMLGNCEFTKEGEKLAEVCRYDKVPGFADYVEEKLTAQSFNVVRGN